jgi:multiple sugar transport system substrate-binding protein
MNALRKAALAMTALTGLAWQAGAANAAEVVWWAPNWGQARAQELVARFEKENPGTKVKLEITVSDGLQNRILVALRSGNTPDLIDVANGWNIPFAQTNQLLPLDDEVAKAKLDLKDFLPAALKTATVNDKLYGLPYRVEAHALIYNKGAYQEAGLDPERPPKTWAELVDYSKKLTRATPKGQQYGFGITGGGEFGNTVFRSLPFIWMNGGSILSDDLKTVQVNSPETVKAVEFYTNMLTKEKVAPPSTLENDGTALRRLFIAGTIAQYQSGQFDLASIHKENPDIKVGTAPIPHPDGKQTAAILGGWNFVIPAKAKNKDDAVKLMAFLAKPENMGFYTDTFPARTSAMDLPRFKDPELAAFKEMLPVARQQPAAANWVQISQTYFNHVQEVLLGGSTPQKAMDAAAEEMKPLLSK